MQDDYPYADCTIRNLYGRVRPVHAAKTPAFWRRNDALPPGAAAERVHQVVCAAENAAQVVVGINTVYRTPIGTDDRGLDVWLQRF